MARELTSIGYFVPGEAVSSRSYWLFPIMSPNSQLFVDFMSKQGFLVFKGSTQMTYVPMPEHLVSKYGDTQRLKEYFQKHVVYLPIKTNLSAANQKVIKTEFLKACKNFQNYVASLSKEH